MGVILRNSHACWEAKGLTCAAERLGEANKPTHMYLYNIIPQSRWNMVRVYTNKALIYPIFYPLKGTLCICAHKSTFHL